MEKNGALTADAYALKTDHMSFSIWNQHTYSSPVPVQNLTFHLIKKKCTNFLTSVKLEWLRKPREKTKNHNIFIVILKITIINRIIINRA